MVLVASKWAMKCHSLSTIAHRSGGVIITDVDRGCCFASASPPPGARGLVLLQTEAPTAAVTGSTTANKPRAASQPPQPAAPQTAGPPFDLLLRPQN
jgi:hypothetical protein